MPFIFIAGNTAMRQKKNSLICLTAYDTISSFDVLFAILPYCQQYGKEKGECMHTVALLSQKGGTGKTTLSLHLAVAAEMDGHHAVVIDLDPQASSAAWKDSRPGETPVVVPVPSTRLTQAIKAAHDGGATLALIDTAPHSGEVAIAAAEAADLVLIPCRAGILDLRAIGTTARIVKLAGKPAYVVLNAVPPRATSILDDARAAVAVHGLAIAPMALRQRAAYAHALTAGQTAQEYEPAGQATEEISSLYQWLLQTLRGLA